MQLVQSLLAPGTSISVLPETIVFQSADKQAGIYRGLNFTDVDANISLSIGDGILLTSGQADNAVDNQNVVDLPDDSDDASVGTFSGTDADLSAIVGLPVEDANVLEFQFTVPATATAIRFDLLFGTEEFPDFVSRGYNDLAGIYLDGIQIAFDDQSRPFTVDNNFFLLNNSGVTTGSNPAIQGKTHVRFAQFEYDGITPTVTTTAPLDVSRTVHRLKFVIADSGDQKLDSGLFLSSLRTTTDRIIDPNTGGSISGTVYSDLNQDGTRDLGDTPIANATVFVDLNSNGTLDSNEQSVTTNNSGEYTLESLSTGQYAVRVLLPDTMVLTQPSLPYNVALAPAQDVVGIDFGVALPTVASSVIRGTKFLDSNANGVRDRGLIADTEPNLLFVLDVSSSARSAMPGAALGDLNGDGIFDSVYDAQIAGLVAMTRDLVDKGYGNTATISIVAYGSTSAEIDLDPITIGLQNQTLAGADRNQNSILDIEEALKNIVPGGALNYESALQLAISNLQSRNISPLRGNIVFLSSGPPLSSSAYLDEAMSLQNAGYNLRAVSVASTAALASLQNIDPQVIAVTTSNQLATELVRLNSGLSQNGFEETGVAGVTIFIDENSNGQLDVGEPSTITTVDDPTTAEKELGRYSLSDLSPGSYLVREVVPSGFLQSFPSGGSHLIQLASGSTSSGHDFGNSAIPSPANNSISGYVYADVDNDGKRWVSFSGGQVAQTGLPNVLVQLLVHETGQVVETHTDANGFYKFSSLADGTYSVRQVQPLQYIDGIDSPGTPTLSALGGTLANDQFVAVKLFGGVSATEYNFGERGLRPYLVTKSLLLTSTPTADQQAGLFVEPGSTRVIARDAGRLVIESIPTGTNVQLFDLQGKQLATTSGPWLTYAMAEGEEIRLSVQSWSASASPQLIHVSLHPQTTEQSVDTWIGQWTNAFLREDVNGDGQVTALDALLIVNRLNSDRNSDGSLSGNYSDVNRDGLITAIDALWVVDRLNQRFGSSSAPLGISQMETRDAVLSEFEFDLDIVNNRKRVTKSAHTV